MTRTLVIVALITLTGLGIALLSVMVFAAISRLRARLVARPHRRVVRLLAARLRTQEADWLL